jgi:hypothetical protein
MQRAHRPQRARGLAMRRIDCLRRLRATVWSGLLAFGMARTVSAQASLLLQGILDGEAWSTNKSSNLLTRNLGRPAGLGRLQMWGAYEPFRHWVLYAQGEAEAGNARAPSETRDINSDQFGIQYSPTQMFVVDAGRLTPLIGTFSTRRFSTRNPLIGIPDGYSLQYPLGVKVSGETRHFDYRAAMVTLPADHLGYVPKATPRLRPAIGGGFTPITGARIGASFSVGPYLNKGIDATQLAGKSWSAYDQHIVALDASFSHGYLETHAEYARGSYDVPGRASAVSGFTYYGEAKYTFTPRFFLAARGERNKYPFIRPTSTANWVANLTDFVDGEVGGGYRLGTSTLLKLSVRGDRWWVRAGAGGFRGQGGHAIALQVSQAFDVLDWFDGNK